MRDGFNIGFVDVVYSFQFSRNVSLYSFNNNTCIQDNVATMCVVFGEPLYPFVMSNGSLYPSGEMRIIPSNKAKYLPNGQLDLSKYFGVVKAKVTPPGSGWHSHFPILPMRYMYVFEYSIRDFI